MLEATSNGIRLRDSATFAECAVLFQQGEKLWSGLNSSDKHVTKTAIAVIELDCTELTQIDSSLLAVLLDWQQQALAKSRSLKLNAVPQNLKHLARLYGVEAWIDGLV